MKIPQEIRSKYLIKQDPEAEFFLDCFDEDKHLRVFEVGANDNHLATMMRDSGFNITSTDLRAYQFPEHENHVHLIGDFCSLSDQFWRECRSKFDVVYSVSAIEHFGLGGYGEGFYKPYYDVIACRYIYDLLKPGGVAYITVPFGGRYVEKVPHWRVYSSDSIERLVQDFIVELRQFRVVEAGGYVDRFTQQRVPCAHVPKPGEIERLTNGEPYISVLLKLRKGKKL